MEVPSHANRSNPSDRSWFIVSPSNTPSETSYAPVNPNDRSSLPTTCGGLIVHTIPSSSMCLPDTPSPAREHTPSQDDDDYVVSSSASPGANDHHRRQASPRSMATPRTEQQYMHIPLGFDTGFLDPDFNLAWPDFPAPPSAEPLEYLTCRDRPPIWSPDVDWARTTTPRSGKKVVVPGESCCSGQQDTGGMRLTQETLSGVSGFYEELRRVRDEAERMGDPIEAGLQEVDVPAGFEDVENMGRRAG
ncbi:hypothetical protein VTK56DRAFT_7228 [Thermocarpiscus australiensis]